MAMIAISSASTQRMGVPRLKGAAGPRLLRLAAMASLNRLRVYCAPSSKSRHPRMPMRCAACQSEIPDTHRFCGSCGAPVAAPSQRPTATAPSPATPRLGPERASEGGLAALALFGFTTALGGRPALGRAAHDA